MTSELSTIRQASDRWTVDDVLLQHEIEQFLFMEAALLDDRRFHEWFDLLADDLEYWMPVRSTTAKGDQESEFAKLGEGAFFDEDKGLMAERIRKLDTAYAWSEDPPSRTRRILSNIRVEKLAGDSVSVNSNFLIYRSRLASEEDLWAGRRQDTLRKTDGGWRIARRHIFLDQVSLGSQNLSIFF